MKKIVSGLLIGLIAMTSLTACQVTSQTNYTVTWRNYDGTILEVDNDVPYGSIPSYDWETPRRDGNDQYSYTFSGWSPEVSEVVSDITYIAQFTSSVNSYTVTWQNYDGTILEVDNDVPYGSIPSYDGETPRRDGNDQYSYTFSGWSPEVSEVVCDVTYIAQFSYEDDLTYTLNSTNDGYVVSKGSRSATYIDIVIPDKHNNLPVTSIADYAFSNCTSLTSVYIPNSVSSIGGYAFSNCTSLASITIPYSVTTIGNYAFENCSSLTIYCESSSEPIDWFFLWNNSYRPVVYNYQGINGVTEDGFKYAVTLDSKENKCITITGYIGEFSDIIIPSTVLVNGQALTVKEICKNAFYDSASLTSIVIPDSVTYIGNYAFSRCSNLTSITIPNSVTSIGDSAFSGCSNLTTVTFGENSQLTTIGKYAFRDCSSLTSITIPDSVTYIGNYAFRNCSSLTIYCEAAFKPIGWSSSWNYSDCPVEWDAIGGGMYNEFEYVIRVDENNKPCIKITDYLGSDSYITIPNPINVNDEEIKVTIIGESAFYNCSNLTSITIPDSVTTIGPYAFSGCSNLTSITIPDSVNTIGSYAFENCSNLTIYCEATSKPSGWSSLWNYSDCPVVWGYVG